MDNTRMREAIDAIIAGFIKMREVVMDDAPEIKPLAAPAAPATKDTYESFDSLKKALESDKWPEAVNKNLVCDPDSEIDKVERGRGIVELMVEEELPNLRFLDYGCGDGYSAVYVATEKAALSVGYDIKTYDVWGSHKKSDNLLFLEKFEDVVAKGPYDVVLLFDVLDHLEKEQPIDVLKQAASVLKPTGRIYMRTHPWTSRHATHMYHDLNKAYVHLVFTEEELDQIATSKHKENNIGVKYPIKTYSDFIKAAGLKEVSRREIKEAVEPFFKIPKIAQRIMNNIDFRQFPEWQMSLQFIDYVLEKDQTADDPAQ
jgi:2-polyprenyl-3-methyl-5-hydroxy-6-metoxy-1,4-benzoquinol methylase